MDVRVSQEESAGAIGLRLRTCCVRTGSQIVLGMGVWLQRHCASVAGWKSQKQKAPSLVTRAWGIWSVWRRGRDIPPWVDQLHEIIEIMVSKAIYVW